MLTNNKATNDVVDISIYACTTCGGVEHEANILLAGLNGSVTKQVY